MYLMSIHEAMREASGAIKSHSRGHRVQSGAIKRIRLPRLHASTLRRYQLRLPLCPIEVGRAVFDNLPTAKGDAYEREAGLKLVVISHRS